MMYVYSMRCVNCQNKISEIDYKCACKIPNLTRYPFEDVNLHLAYVDIYQKIANSDLTMSMQDVKNLEEKAESDLKILNRNRLFTNGKKLRVLEIGPGQGHLARLLMPKCDYLATDVIENYLENLSCPTFVSNCEFLPDFESKFDLIIACDVLEHVLNEGNAWLSLYNSLTPSGLLFIRSPNSEPLVHYANYFGNSYPIVHLRSYDKQSIETGARSVGFRIRKCGYLSRSPSRFALRNFGISRVKEFNASNLLYSLIKVKDRDSNKAVFNLDNKSIQSTETTIARLASILENSVSPTVFSFVRFVMLRVLYRPIEVYLLAQKK